MTARKHIEAGPKSRGGKLARICEIVTGEPKTPRGDECVNFPGHVIRKPDPCIYSQFMLMQLDQPVTWDNPDVAIYKDGVEQDTYNLEAGTEYRIEITVRNSSRDEPAPGTVVDVRWIEFGAGGQTRHPITTLSADVPIWPGTDTVSTTWRTPETPGHYCIEVELTHPDDANPANNRGWNNTQVHAANSPVHRKIRIYNRYPDGCPPVEEGGGPYLRPERVFAGWGVLGAVFGFLLYGQGPAEFSPLARAGVMVGGGYVALTILGLVAESIYAWIQRRTGPDEKESRSPERTSCELVEIDVDSYVFDDDKTGKDFDPEKGFRGEPPAWPARVEPDRFRFQPGEDHRDVELIVDAPDDPGPPANFNVNVRQGGVPAGGVTVTITREEP